MGNIDARYDNPNRLPNWIWMRATEYYEGTGRKPTASRDGGIENLRLITRAADFIRARDGCRFDKQVRWLINRFPDIYWAAHAFEHEEGSPKFYIEAALLARESDADIARATGYGPEIIHAYEKLFFNVRERLGHFAYIFTVVLGDIHAGMDGRDYGMIWKLFAYNLGPGVLEALVRIIPLSGWAKNVEEAAALFENVTIASMKVKCAVASTVLPVSTENQLELLHIFNNFIEIERSTAAGGTGQQDFTENMKVMLQQLPFEIGGVDKKGGPMQFWDESGGDLYADEQLLLAGGQTPPALPPLKDIPIPGRSSQ